MEGKFFTKNTLTFVLILERVASEMSNMKQFYMKRFIFNFHTVLQYRINFVNIKVAKK